MLAGIERLLEQYEGIKFNGKMYGDSVVSKNAWRAALNAIEENMERTAKAYEPYFQDIS